MKVFILLMVSSICYYNVSGRNLFEIGATVAAKCLKCRLSRTLDLDVSKIDVYFYDFRNGVSKHFPVEKAAKGILTIKNLNKNNKFFMYIGGFKSHIEKKSTERIKNTFKHIDNSYLIIVDHSAYTHKKNGYKTSYERSVKHVPDIGKKVAKMLADLKAGGVSPKTIHGIGHSLGGQILGYVGENFIKLTGQKISRITALDPAGPCFTENSDEENIRSGLADYVEIYHCNAGAFGSKKSLGDVNFFVNGGKSQPTCGDTSSLSITEALVASKCSHKICVMIWTASVLNQNWYSAYKCENYKYFKHGKCSQNEKTTAGFWNPGTASGNYYFSADIYPDSSNKKKKRKYFFAKEKQPSKDRIETGTDVTCDLPYP